MADIRSRELGFVFQAYNLLPRTSALENVELPMLYAGVAERERRAAALTALDEVGLAKYADHHPNQLSGGQQQRVAIARSLVNDPKLDPCRRADRRARRALDAPTSWPLFRRLNEERGITIMLVTHEPDVAALRQTHRHVPRRQRRRRRAYRGTGARGLMNITIIARMALIALLRNRSRSLLTMLGVVIGVAAVIITVAIGAGARTSVQPTRSTRWAAT